MIKDAKAANRLRLISAIWIIVAVLLIAKLYFVQVVKGDDFRARASDQYVRVPTTLFDRGSIFMTSKDGTAFPAANIKTGYVLAINPQRIENPEQIFKELNESLPDLDHDVFIQKSSKTDDPYEEVAYQVDTAAAEKIAQKEYPGVMLFKQQWRFYPGESLAAQTIGFMSYTGDGEGRKGTYGLERYYEDILSRDGGDLYSNLFAEAFLQVRQAVDGTHGKGDIYLTLEPTVQGQLEQELNKTRKTWNSSMTAGIIMDPNTGEIFAIAANPTFDPNNYNQVDDLKVFMNPLVEDVFEMGSIMKPLTVAFGLDKGVITPQTTYYDPGMITVNGRKISNYDGRARGTVPMQEILNQSLNTGVAFIEGKLGNKVFGDYMRSVFESQTDIDLPNEGTNLISNLTSPRDVEYVTASFGQGIAVTPISMIRGLAALANGGTLPPPHVVKEVRTDIGVSDIVEYPEGPRVISPETSEKITRMLVTVVDDALAGGSKSMDHYSIAAKTGTAQIADANGKYREDLYMHTFFGYFPAYEPRFIIFLMNQEPKGARYASETLTDPFMELTKFLISYYQLPPDRQLTSMDF